VFGVGHKKITHNVDQKLSDYINMIHAISCLALKCVLEFINTFNIYSLILRLVINMMSSVGSGVSQQLIAFTSPELILIQTPHYLAKQWPVKYLAEREDTRRGDIGLSRDRLPCTPWLVAEA